MSTKAGSSQRWFAPWRAARRPLPDDDPADQGTAFGLDMSMLEAAPAPVPAPQSRPGWAQRLALRWRPPG
jgi:hypothetical protein